MKALQYSWVNHAEFYIRTSLPLNLIMGFTGFHSYVFHLPSKHWICTSPSLMPSISKHRSEHLPVALAPSTSVQALQTKVGLHGNCGLPDTGPVGWAEMLMSGGSLDSHWQRRSLYLNKTGNGFIIMASAYLPCIRWGSVKQYNFVVFGVGDVRVYTRATSHSIC